jgi:hypothetical protein
MTPKLISRCLVDVLHYLSREVQESEAAELFLIEPLTLSILHELTENHPIGQSNESFNRFTKQDRQSSQASRIRQENKRLHSNILFPYEILFLEGKGKF